MGGKRIDNGISKGTVLVVDDDPDIIDFLETALEDAGYLVLAAVGAESLGVAHELHPDVILLDINMPGMNSSSSQYCARPHAPFSDPFEVIEALPDVNRGASGLSLRRAIQKWGVDRRYCED